MNQGFLSLLDIRMFGEGGAPTDGRKEKEVVQQKERGGPAEHGCDSDACPF